MSKKVHVTSLRAPTIPQVRFISFNKKTRFLVCFITFKIVWFTPCTTLKAVIAVVTIAVLRVTASTTRKRNVNRTSTIVRGSIELYQKKLECPIIFLEKYEFKNIRIWFHLSKIIEICFNLVLYFLQNHASCFCSCVELFESCSSPMVLSQGHLLLSVICKTRTLCPNFLITTVFTRKGTIS